MLGFAMSLEEVQRTLMLQADSKVRRDNADRKEAETEARNACERIDERFRLLVGLFQCKYRDKKWGVDGDFGPGTPRVDGVGGEFLRELRMLVEDRGMFFFCCFCVTEGDADSYPQRIISISAKKCPSRPRISVFIRRA